MSEKKLTSEQQNELIDILKKRFEKNIQRHKNIEWQNVQLKLESKPEKLRTLFQMEKTGGEPDVILFDNDKNELFFVDCSQESPSERRSLCYDRESLNSRKENKPKNSVIDMSTEIGIELLNEEQYRKLQEYGNFDTKTSSWIKTPESIRKLGGAIFADFRYGNIFVYHNTAQSYYSSRGFRGLLRV